MTIEFFPINTELPMLASLSVFFVSYLRKTLMVRERNDTNEVKHYELAEFHQLAQNDSNGYNAVNFF